MLRFLGIREIQRVGLAGLHDVSKIRSGLDVFPMAKRDVSSTINIRKYVIHYQFIVLVTERIAIISITHGLAIHINRALSYRAIATRSMVVEKSVSKCLGLGSRSIQ